MIRPVLFLAMASWVCADLPPVTPYTPPAFETRNTGTNGEVSNTITPETKPARKVTYVEVCESRDWKNHEGRTIQASLLAWEEGDAARGRTDLSLVQDGKVRMLLPGNRVTPYPLANLSEADRKFIDGLVLARKQAAEKAAEEAGPQR